MKSLINRVPHKTIAQVFLAGILLALDYYGVYTAPLEVYQALGLGSIITFKMRLDETLEKVKHIPQVGTNKSVKSVSK